MIWLPHVKKHSVSTSPEASLGESKSLKSWGASPACVVIFFFWNGLFLYSQLQPAYLAGGLRCLKVFKGKALTVVSGLGLLLRKTRKLQIELFVMLTRRRACSKLGDVFRLSECCWLKKERSGDAAIVTWDFAFWPHLPKWITKRWKIWHGSDESLPNPAPTTFRTLLHRSGKSMGDFHQTLVVRWLSCRGWTGTCCDRRTSKYPWKYNAWETRADDATRFGCIQEAFTSGAKGLSVSKCQFCSSSLRILSQCGFWCCDCWAGACVSCDEWT